MTKLESNQPPYVPYLFMDFGGIYTRPDDVYVDSQEFADIYSPSSAASGPEATKKRTVGVLSEIYVLQVLGAKSA